MLLVQYSLEIYFFPFCQPQKYILNSQEMCNVNKNVNLFTSSDQNLTMTSIVTHIVFAKKYDYTNSFGFQKCRLQLKEKDQSRNLFGGGGLDQHTLGGMFAMHEFHKSPYQLTSKLS